MDDRGARVLVPRVTLWECPSCGGRDRTTEARPHSRMHACAALGGMTAPMVPAGTRAEHQLVEREDYVGTEHVQVDVNGRPWMAVRTMRDDGYDTSVYAPTAVATRD
jgi:hypothetical protein